MVTLLYILLGIVSVYVGGVVVVFLYGMTRRWHFGPVPQMLVVALAAILWPLYLWHMYLWRR